MNDKLSIQDFVKEIVKSAGIPKKLAEELVSALPEVISEGLEKDGQVRISGLGTFRLKFVKERVGHNFKTGLNINIPAHNKLVFHPEKQMQEKVNEDFRFLTYKVLNEEAEPEKADANPKIESYSPAFDSDSTDEVFTAATPEPIPLASALSYEVNEPGGTPEPTAPEKTEAPLAPRRNKYFWVIPGVFLVIILLLVVFYFRTCRQEPVFEKTGDKSGSEQIIKASGPITGNSDSSLRDSSAEQAKEMPVPDEKISKEVNPSVSPPEKAVSNTGTSEATHYIVPEGQRLYQIARQEYQDPQLWALIYKANKDKIPDPDNLYAGIQLVIPALEGSPRHLTSNDSLEISKAYKMLYEYYSAKQDPRANNFLNVSKDFGIK